MQWSQAKQIILAALLGGAGSLYSGDRIIDEFDWGAGVSGRSSLNAGDTINGITVQTGTAVWSVPSGSVVFSGSAGVGNGALLMTNGNAILQCSFTPAETVIATAKGSFTPGTGSVKGFFIGFQAAAPDVTLLSNQTTDKIYVQLGSTGALTFRSVIGGVTNNGSGTNPTFSSGDTVQLKLTLNTIAKTASILATNMTAGTAGTKSLTYTGTPSWHSFAVNQTGSSILNLDSVNVGPSKLLRLISLTSP